MRELKDKKAVVVGLGRSGEAAARLLASRGAKVVVLDHKGEEELRPQMQALEPLGIEVRPGGHHKEALKGADLLVLSPGVDPSLPLWQEARRQGTEVMGELELAARSISEPIIAVTGTNGKTTTTHLIGHLLREARRRVFVGGNIGSPVAEYLLGGERADFVVLEVSSFQLETISTFRPWVAVLLNVGEDHLDRHRSFGDYLRAKARIFENQAPEDWAVLNLDDPPVRGLLEASQIPSSTLPFSKEPLDRREGAFLQGEDALLRLGGIEERVSLRPFPLRGEHNVENALAALLVGRLCGLEPQEMEGALGSFRPLPHRLEFVGEVKGVTFWNDSKATNPSATLRALEAMEGPVVLIAGGRNKGLDLGPLRRAARKKVRAVVALGEAGPEVERAFQGLAPVMRAQGMEEAVRLAFENSSPGEAVLLSPACASFDMFRDYRERGEAFRSAVERLRDGG